jgi:hypothetical protein
MATLFRPHILYDVLSCKRGRIWKKSVVGSLEDGYPIRQGVLVTRGVAFVYYKITQII